MSITTTEAVSRPFGVSQTTPLPASPELPGVRFQRFGEWSDRVSVARDGSIHRLARWMSLHPDAPRFGQSENQASVRLWDACREANPSCFKGYRTARLDRSSYFLPADEVVFSVLENPTQIPDSPPCGVMLRRLEAMDAFPLAKFYFLRPVFTEPTPASPDFRLLPPDELREEAAGDRRVALQIARRFGWAHRAERWSRRQAENAGRFALKLATRAVEEIIARLPHNDWEGSNSANTRFASQSLAQLALNAEADGRHGEAARFRASLAELRRRMDIDPVLCFELPDRPGELWFEAHWYEGADGRTYVHF